MTTIPSRDGLFRRVVENVAGDSPPADAEELASRLRPLYPRVAVFEREISGERGRFYVYRDGHYELDDREAWWERPGTAAVRVSAHTGRVTSVTGEWARLMGTDPSDVVGRHYADLIVPEARSAARAMFDALRDQQEVRSQARVVRPDGGVLGIEFRATEEDGEIEVRYRPLDP